MSIPSSCSHQEWSHSIAEKLKPATVSEWFRGGLYYFLFVFPFFFFFFILVSQLMLWRVKKKEILSELLLRASKLNPPTHEISKELL